LHGRDGARQGGQWLWALAAQAGHGHAVQVARGADLGQVAVGVRVQPQHAQALAGSTAVARDGADGAGGQGVVAAQHDGHAPGLQLGVHRIVRAWFQARITDCP